MAIVEKIPMNSTENTPAHCHDCHKFADCSQAKYMNGNTEPVKGWIDTCSVYCAGCLDSKFLDDDSDNDWGALHNTFEGESDSPVHCDGCGIPIIHDLTVEGVEYVRKAIADGSGCCREVWSTVWSDYDIKPKIQVNSIVIPGEYVTLCEGWAGGTGCMLRAISSTGKLTIGNLPPRGCDTNEKWYYNIWLQLSSDVGYVARLASNSEDGDYGDADYLAEFENWVNTQCERLCESYGLEDWDQDD